MGPIPKSRFGPESSPRRAGSHPTIPTISKSEICFSCKNSISGKYFEIRNKKYHPEHFTCIKCRKSLEFENNILEDNGTLVCSDCRSYPPCFVCNKAITNVVCTAMNRTFHQECFVCHNCKNPIKGHVYIVNRIRNVYCSNCHF